MNWAIYSIALDFSFPSLKETDFIKVVLSMLSLLFPIGCNMESKKNIKP